MPMVPANLAQGIADALGADAPTPQIIGEATAYVNAMLAATFSHPSIVGVTAPGAPLSAGAAPGGLILGLVGPKIGADIASALGAPATPQILGTADGFATHMMTAMVNFDTGMVVGQCTNTPTSPGPLAAGAAQNGKIMGLSDSALAGLWAAIFGGKSKELEAKAKAIVDFFSNECVASYPTGGVVGLCPPGGGPLAAGVGVGGMFL